MKDFRITSLAEDADLTNAVMALIEGAFDICSGVTAFESSIAGATGGQRAILACRWYRFEVENGGHWQYFYNSGGMMWKDALQGLKLLGANDHANILEDATTLFPHNRPSKNRLKRFKQLESIDSQTLNALDSRYSALTDIDPYFARYIQEHRDEFFVMP